MADRREVRLVEHILGEEGEAVLALEVPNAERGIDERVARLNRERILLDRELLLALIGGAQLHEARPARAAERMLVARIQADAPLRRRGQSAVAYVLQRAGSHEDAGCIGQPRAIARVHGKVARQDRCRRLILQWAAEAVDVDR